MKSFTGHLQRLLLLTLAIIPSTNLCAQWRIGIQGGYTHNELCVSSSYDYDRNYSPRGGFTVGVPVQYEFFNWFALQADLSYLEKNYHFYRTGSYSRVYQNTRNSYLELPIYAQFSFGGKKLKGFLNVGAYAGYWLSSHAEGIVPLDFGTNPQEDIYSYNEKVDFDSQRDNRFEGGLLIGVGIKYQLTHKTQLFAEGRYLYGLTDLQKDYMLKQVPRYNNTIVIQIGCSFTLGEPNNKKQQDIHL